MPFIWAALFFSLIMRTTTLKHLFLICILYFLYGCEDEKDYLFLVVNDSGIDFSNDLNYTQELNPYTYRNYYNGAGIGVADFDNDGLEDIYFSGNQVDNALYRNLGNLKFEKVESSPILNCTGSWSTGVSIVDINQDGLKDIYVCKAGPPEGPRRYNELFINNGNFEFTESAEKYGLRIKGFSIHATFFDFDKDGDLDCYLLNNSLRSVGGYNLQIGLRDKSSTQGNMLLVNEDGVYKNHSEELGIYTSDIGFGLGVNTSDLNGDGWVDIYVANDFFEKDYFYLNDEGKGFMEVGDSYFSCFSLGSMGVDAADIDNDGDCDIIVAEMMPSTLERKKTKATYENWDKYQKSVKSGYAHQLPRNMLHINNGGYFSDVSRMKGVDATEWSWAPLIFDMNNDGLKDIFISNGVGKDLLDRDYLSFMADEQRLQELVKNRDQESLKNLIDIMPSGKVQNSFFTQDDKFIFSDKSETLTNMKSSISNGSTLSDLDNDGDLDIIISNINDKAVILENAATNNFVNLVLIGDRDNINAIGAEAEVKNKDLSFHATNNPYRGFQSTITSKLTIGLGSAENVDKVLIKWTDGSKERFENIRINKSNEIIKGNGIVLSEEFKEMNALNIRPIDSLAYQYPIRPFNEFNKEKLLPSMLPSNSPVVSKYLEHKGSPSLFYGGSQNFGVRNVLSSSGLMDSLSFISSFRSHVTHILPFDSDNDGDLDVYMAHGSRVFTPYSTELDDVIYENVGDDVYELKKDAIVFDDRIVTGAIAANDMNNDGLVDLIVGERIRDDTYGLSTRIFYYSNLGNSQFKLTDTEENNLSLGMISDIEINDIDGDSKPEIIVTGEWMGIRLFRIENEKLVDVSIESEILSSSGFWRDIHIVDIDNDGDLDILGANQGLNSFISRNLKLYVSDFDDNGRSEQIHALSINGKDYPIHDFDEIMSQLPKLRSKVPNYSAYSTSSMDDLFDQKLLDKIEVKTLDELRSGVFINDSFGFRFIPFPAEVQQSSMHAIEVDDINNDGLLDVLIGGNHFLYKPQFGKDDASQGHVILGRKGESGYEFGDVESLNITGEIRFIQKVDDHDFLIGVNGENLIKYRIRYE